MTKGRRFEWHYRVRSVPNSTEPVNPTASHIPALKEVSFNIHRKMAMCQSAEIKAESQGTMLLNSSWLTSSITNMLTDHSICVTSLKTMQFRGLQLQFQPDFLLANPWEMYIRLYLPIIYVVHTVTTVNEICNIINNVNFEVIKKQKIL